jgi:hypothetical protein
MATKSAGKGFGALLIFSTVMQVTCLVGKQLNLIASKWGGSNSNGVAAMRLNQMIGDE